MADEKILKDESLKDEQLSDEELDKVAGGGWIDMIDPKNPFTNTASNQPGDVGMNFNPQ